MKNVFNYGDTVSISGPDNAVKCFKGTLVYGFGIVNKEDGDNVHLRVGDIGIYQEYDEYDGYCLVQMKNGEYEGCILGIDIEDLQLN